MLTLEKITTELKEKISFIQKRSNQVILITGPSGAGKGTLISFLEHTVGFQEAPYVTTRQPIRPGEIEKGSYGISHDELYILEGTGKLFLIVTAYGNAYAYDIDIIYSLLAANKKLIMESPPNRIEGEVEYLLPQAIKVGVVPTDENFTQKTLQKRATDSPEKQVIRVAEGKADQAHCALLEKNGIIQIITPKFGNIDHTYQQVIEILANTPIEHPLHVT